MNADYVFYARVFGVVSLILSCGILFNLGHARHMAKAMVNSPSGYVFCGVLPTIFGSWVVIHIYSGPDVHSTWPTAVLVIGWLMLLTGIVRTCLPGFWARTAERFIGIVPVLFALFGLIFGLLLSYVGFVSHHL